MPKVKPPMRLTKKEMINLLQPTKMVATTNFKKCFDEFKNLCEKADGITEEVFSGSSIICSPFLDYRIDIVYNDVAEWFTIHIGINGHGPKLNAHEYVLQSTHGIPF